MKSRYIPILYFLLSCLSLSSQDKQTDFPLFSVENLEFTALKSFFYIVRQEYVLLDESGKSLTRGGNDYYGKAYAIGVSDDNTQLWFPGYIRSPWEIDETFDKQANKNFKPECSIFCSKNYSDQDYFKTIIPSNYDNDLVMHIPAGKLGIPLEKSQPRNGTLVVFYSSSASPDDFSLISHTLMYLEDITWDSRGVADIEDLHYGNNTIIGGVLFSRYLSPGLVKWKLSGFYFPMGDNWIIKSVNNK